jgi:hypothetical protein
MHACIQWLKYKIWGPGIVSSLGAPDHCREPGTLCQWLKKTGTRRNAVISIFWSPELRSGVFRLTLTTAFTEAMDV